MTRIKVLGRIDGAAGATVTIDRKLRLFTVRPKGRRRTFELPLAFVAEMVVAKVVKQELPQ